MNRPAKHLITGLVASLALGCLLAFMHFQLDLFDLKPLEFASYTDLGADKISNSEYQVVLGLHNQCFDETKKQNLYLYLTQEKYPDSKDSMKELLKERVEAYMQSSRLEKAKSLREIENVTVIRKNQNIIALYNCKEDFNITDGSIMIFNVCLQPSLRGKGIGKKIILHAIDRCKEEGKDLTLTVYKDNETAIKLYEKLDFKIVEPTKAPEDEFSFFNKYLMKFTPPSATTK